MRQYNNCNSISTSNSEIEIGNQYQYYESYPLCIWDVELLEDNSTDDMIKLKLKLLNIIAGIKLDIGTEFEVSMVNTPIAFGGMWRLYNKGKYA